MFVAQHVAPSRAGAHFRGNLFTQDLPRDIGRVLGGKKLENEGRVQPRAMPLQLQQSAIVVVRDLANVKWASHRPKTRRVAQQAQRASKIMFQCGWSAASPDFSI
jgi:hypothetical protein